MAIRLKGARNLRYRLVCATLAGRPIRIDDIRLIDVQPGLHAHEASFLRLLEKISNGCVVEINETGTKLRYVPGVLTGGKNLSHDCGTSRAMGYFLEPLFILGLFGKKPLSITLRGVTNDDVDPSVDTCRTTMLPLLKHFGVPMDEVELKILKRGAPPGGGGEVSLCLPMITSFTPVHFTDEGIVKRVRGVAYSTRVSPQMANRMVDAVRAVLNRLLPDVYVFTDHFSRQDAGRSPGFGVSLVAETTTGCLIGAERAMEGKRREGNELDGDYDASEGGVEMPEDVGKMAAQTLLQEIKWGGVVDSTHQGFLCMLCALCPNEVSKIRLGPLTTQAIVCLRDIKEVLGVQFHVKTEESTGTVLLSCVGSGFKNLSRKIS